MSPRDFEDGNEENNKDAQPSSDAAPRTEDGIETTTPVEILEMNYVEPAHEQQNREVNSHDTTALQ